MSAFTNKLPDAAKDRGPFYTPDGCIPPWVVVFADKQYFSVGYSGGRLSRRGWMYHHAKVEAKTCAECHTKNLTHYFTSQRDGRHLCLTCFEKRADKELAREEGQSLKKTKKPHPLDIIQGTQYPHTNNV